MVGLSVAKVLVVLTIVALLVASFGAQQRHRRPDPRRGPYRASPRKRVADPWNWYRWSNRVMLIAPGLLLLLRVPFWLALGASGVVWAAALAAILGFRCPRCARVFGGFAERCRHCSLPRYADPDPHE